MQRKTLKRTLLALSLALPLAAFARDAIVVDNIELQAGPDQDYPTITQLPAGSEVQVQGCIDNYNWCDVLASGDRGWVPGTFLAEEYDGNRVLIVDAGPRIGIPVVSFEIGAYWGEHYHNRPFYPQRETFVSRHIAPHAPRRPSEVALNRVNVRVQGSVGAGGEHEHAAGTATRESAQTSSGTQTDVRARTGSGTHTDVRGQASSGTHTGVSGQADVRTHDRDQSAHHAASNTASNTGSNTGSSASTSGNTTQQQHAMSHSTPPPAQSGQQTQESSRATAETRGNERNVPNTRNDQREGAHGMQQSMPPTVQGGEGQHQVATNKSSSQPHERADQSKQPPKSDKSKDKDKDESNKDHDHDH